jgi:hypothetical protein
MNVEKLPARRMPRAMPDIASVENGGRPSREIIFYTKSRKSLDSAGYGIVSNCGKMKKICC